MGVCGTRVTVLLGNVLLSLFYLSESLQVSVLPHADDRVEVLSQVKACTLCIGNATSPDACDGDPANSVSLSPGESAALNFQCSEPLEKAYRAEIQRLIACTKDLCRPSTGMAQSSLLTQLPRNLSWLLDVPEDTMVKLSIIGDGLKEVSETTVCGNGPKYILSRTKLNGMSEDQAFCPGGSTTDFTLQGDSALMLIPKAGQEAPTTVFSVTAKPLKGRAVSVTLDPDVTMVISREGGGLKCDVCTNQVPPCNPSTVSFSKVATAEVEFGCLLPEEVFNVRLQRTIECTEKACAPTTGKVLPNQLTDFRRTFSWDVALPKRSVLTLDFPSPGLKETTAKEGCQGGRKYSFQTMTGNGALRDTTYCSGGALTQLSFLGKTALVLDVPRGEELNADAFTANSMPRSGRNLPLSPEPETDIAVRRAGPEPECEVCIGQKCDPTAMTLRGAGNVSFEFGCPAPQELYTAQITQEIDCTKTPCQRRRVRPQATLFPDFNRTFIWDLKVINDHAAQMDFPEPGLRQVPNGEVCPDGHTYSLVMYLRSGPTKIGTYCRGGTLSTIQVRFKGRMMLEVPGDRPLDLRDFELSVGPQITALATLRVDLPRGVSQTSFSSAHYPGDFPSGEQMSWDVRVPGMHNYSVQLTEQRMPDECLGGRVELQYQAAGGKVTRPALGAPQPRHQQGNFNMTLANCQTNQTLDGLRMDFTVSVMRSGHPVLCTVDLTGKADLSVQIEKTGTDPYCEMSVDAVVKDKVRIDPGTRAKLSFLDCPKEDLVLTASRVIDSPACRGSASCPVAERLLTVPSMEACLPMDLQSFTWHLLVPDTGTLEIRSPSAGGLRQSLPGQECSGSGALRLSEWVGEGGHPIGTFCPQGVVEKVQIHANVSVTVETRAAARAKGPCLNVSVTKEIPERIIYTVRPEVSAPAQLATPNWPDGMMPTSTVSWMVRVPPKFLAVVKFSNVTQPKCDLLHTGIKVHPMGSKEETLSRNENEPLEDQLVSESFYLNMSNCVPDSGSFSALTTVTLQPKGAPLGIILGVLAAVLLLVLLAVGVGLFLKQRKKSSKAAKEASIYIGKGNIFRPADTHFAKPRSENASHVYDSIDDTMVYGHLLRDSTYAEDLPDQYNGMQVDSYRTFVGPPDAELAAINEGDLWQPRSDGGGAGEGFQTFLDPADSFMPARPRTPLSREESLGFQDRRMVDNELYTFKSTGGFNTIRLSGADQQASEVL